MAQLRGVEVLNINELANALKPVVLPGEIMKVFILKEGKEYNQGVAYLDDGTMVVVDNARKMISKTIDIVVTSVSADDGGQDDLRPLHRSEPGVAAGRHGRSRRAAPRIVAPDSARAGAVARGPVGTGRAGATCTATGTGRTRQRIAGPVDPDSRRPCCNR